MTKARGPAIVRIRLPIKAPTRSITGLALGSLMILGTVSVWVWYPERFTDPCVMSLLLAMGIGTFLAGASWFAVDHAIIIDNEKRAVLLYGRKASSSLLNARDIEVRREPLDRPFKRMIWCVYLVKTTEQESLLWRGRRRIAACRIAQQLSKQIRKPWTLHTDPGQTDSVQQDTSSQDPRQTI
jgi:hypothetical protein